MGGMKGADGGGGGFSVRTQPAPGCMNEFTARLGSRTLTGSQITHLIWFRDYWRHV